MNRKRLGINIDSNRYNDLVEDGELTLVLTSNGVTNEVADRVRVEYEPGKGIIAKVIAVRDLGDQQELKIEVMHG